MRIRQSEWTAWAAVAVVVALVVSCAPPPETDGERADYGQDGEQAVLEAHRGLTRAYEKGDIEAVVALLEPSSDLLIFHPLLENRFDGIDEVREHLGTMFSRIGTVTWTDVHPFLIVRGDTAWLTYQVLLSSDGSDWAFVGRGTEVWVRGEAGWRLAHGHWSQHPDQEG